MGQLARDDTSGKKYDICDQGQHLNGESTCLNNDYETTEGSNRCFFLSVLASLRAHRRFDRLTSEQAVQLSQVYHNQLMTPTDDLLEKLCNIIGVHNVVVAVYQSVRSEDNGKVQLSEDNGKVQLSLSLNTVLGHIEKGSQSVKVAHIMAINDNHFVALVPLPEGCDPEKNQECVSCSRRPVSDFNCEAECKSSEKRCGNKKRQNMLTCWVHRTQEDNFQKLKVTEEKEQRDRVDAQQKELDRYAAQQLKVTKEKEQWECPKCTFLNARALQYCELCETPKP